MVAHLVPPGKQVRYQRAQGQSGEQSPPHNTCAKGEDALLAVPPKTETSHMKTSDLLQNL